MGREWLNLIRVRVRRQRVVITSLCSFLSFCLLFFSSLMFLLKNDGVVSVSLVLLSFLFL